MNSSISTKIPRFQNSTVLQLNLAESRAIQDRINALNAQVEAKARILREKSREAKELEVKRLKEVEKKLLDHLQVFFSQSGT